MYPNLEMLVWLFDSGDFGLAIPSSVAEGTSTNLGGKGLNFDNLTSTTWGIPQHLYYQNKFLN